MGGERGRGGREGMRGGGGEREGVLITRVSFTRIER